MAKDIRRAQIEARDIRTTDYLYHDGLFWFVDHIFHMPNGRVNVDISRAFDPGHSLIFRDTDILTIALED